MVTNKGNAMELTPTEYLDLIEKYQLEINPVEWQTDEGTFVEWEVISHKYPSAWHSSGKLKEAITELIKEIEK